MNTCSRKFESKCLVFADNRKIITVEEHRKKFILDNSTKRPFAPYRIDGCIIQNGPKCDFLLLNCEERKDYFIELKGSDLGHAVEQINATVDTLINHLPEFQQFHARIVLSKVNTPNLRSVKLAKLKQKMNRLGGTVVYKEAVLTEPSSSDS